MPIITRKFTFDSAHRVLGHEGKCRHLHGHRYEAEVTVQSKELDNLGRVIDFSILKERIGGWIDEHWDHNILLHRNDPLLARDVFDEKAPYVMGIGLDQGYPINPTAENIAKDLFYQAQILLPELTIVNVRIYETANCYADYHPHS